MSTYKAIDKYQHWVWVCVCYWCSQLLLCYWVLFRYSSQLFSRSAAGLCSVAGVRGTYSYLLLIARPSETCCGCFLVLHAASASLAWVYRIGYLYPGGLLLNPDRLWGKDVRGEVLKALLVCCTLPLRAWRSPKCLHAPAQACRTVPILNSYLLLHTLKLRKLSYGSWLPLSCRSVLFRSH